MIKVIRNILSNKKRTNKIMITDDKKKEIEEIVNKKIAENPDLSIPAFDLIRFLQEKEGFIILSQDMQDDTTGLVLINDKSNIIGDYKKIIIVNSKLQKDISYKQRRRFIIAHEYGHFLLHKSEGYLFAHRDTSKKGTKEELQADYFAKCLLMPRNLVEAEIKRCRENQLEESDFIKNIAQTFNVTEKKAKERVIEINQNA